MRRRLLPRAFARGVLAALIGAAANGAASAQTITEFPIPTGSSRPTGLTVGPDGNLWFTEHTAGKIGRMTTTGAVTEFTVPSSPFDIVSGPDGNLWFIAGGGSKIGRITTTGVLAEFPLPNGGSAIRLTVGPDGALWFTETANKIGRMTTTGAVTEFPVPTVFSGAWDIVTGPDGNLWFTESGAKKLGRTTPAGVITEFPLPPGSGPYEIAAGPDGNLWYTKPGDEIGRATPEGVITEFLLPSWVATKGPAGITAGPDGNLWFTEAFANRIGRITTAGAVTEFFIPSAASHPTWIVAGPDDNLWFTEENGNRIGRITPTGAPAVFYTLDPCRLVDTRTPLTGGPPLDPAYDRTFTVAGRCAVPPTAVAISANLTVTGATDAGDLRVYAEGTSLPSTSSINYGIGQTRANNAIVRLGPLGEILVSCDQASGTVHFILDVNGYFN